MDNLLQSYDNLLNYVTAEHEADHEDGYCDSEKSDCVTCDWLWAANKNYDLLKKLFASS